MGDQQLPRIAVEAIGKSALASFKAGGKCIGKTIGVAGEHLASDALATDLTEGLNVPVTVNAVEPSVYRNFGFPDAKGLGNMLQFNRDFSDYCCDARTASRYANAGNVARGLRPAHTARLPDRRRYP